MYAMFAIFAMLPQQEDATKAILSEIKSNVTNSKAKSINRLRIGVAGYSIDKQGSKKIFDNTEIIRTDITNGECAMRLIKKIPIEHLKSTGEEVYAWNKLYNFSLNKKDRKSGYVISNIQFDATKQDYTPINSFTAMLPYNCFLENCDLLSISNKYHIDSYKCSISANECTISINGLTPITDAEVHPVVKCQFRLDVNSNYVNSYSLVRKMTDTKFKLIDGTKCYKLHDGIGPLLIKEESLCTYSDTGNKSITISTFDYSVVDMKENDFTLTAFGFAEPNAITRSYDYSIWFFVIGAVLLVIAITFSYRRRRVPS